MLERIIENLKKNNKTISTMESCTGGYIVNSITNIPGASKVLNFSAVTYSNKYKVKMGVSKKIIDEYTVYSKEVAQEMSKAISKFSSSNYGIGITGKLGVKDSNNLIGNDNQVFVSIYNSDKDIYISFDLLVHSDDREECKKEILDEIILKLYEYLSDEDV